MRPKEMVSPGPDFESIDRARSRFTRPLEEISGEIPVGDILEDVQDVGVLAAYARVTSGRMLVLRNDTNGTVVPVLTQKGLLEQYQNMGWPFSPYESGWFTRKFFVSSFGEKALEEVSLQIAEESFFSGLKSFLAARIGGVRWWRSGGPAGGGRSGGGGTRSGGGGGAQLWEVHTAGSGLSLAYHGTHTARAGTALAGGVTSPVDVYLPMGTLYLGANTGPRGAYVFDYGVQLDVPSTHAHPIHKTQAF